MNKIVSFLNKEISYRHLTFQYRPALAAVLINYTYYTQYYAHVKDLCLGMKSLC